MATKVPSASTEEGKWEMRDGKYYRRDVVSISGGEQQRHTVKVKCPNCPAHMDRIQKLTAERDNLQRLLKERDTLIKELRARLEKLEMEAKSWASERSRMETIIRERETTIRELRMQLEQRKDWVPGSLLKEKETIIIRLQNTIRDLEAQLAGRNKGDGEISRLNLTITDLRARIKELEDLLIKARSEVREIHVAPAPPKEEMRWYYAVQDPAHAQLFQAHPRYLGGEIMVDSLEGATVVNPEYYTQSEQVPGNARLRVRVVEAQGVQLHRPGVELFVRLRLGSATQFTHPRPIAFPSVSWQQDFVFVGVPLKPHPYHPRYQASTYPLIIEVVARQIGTAVEEVIGTGEVDLVDLVAGLTRVIFINMNTGGCVNLRLKALDFGLPAGGVQEAATVHTTHHVIESSAHVVRPAGHTEIRTHTDVNVGSAEMARRLDAADGVIDGKMGDASIHVNTALKGLEKKESHYNVSSAEMARRLDAADGTIDGQYKGQDIHIKK